MGKIEALGAVVALAGLLGAQATDPPAEAEQIATVKSVIGMSREEFASWCRGKTAISEATFESNEERQASCAWIHGETGRVWHAVLHFDPGAPNAYQADTGLLDASAETLFRLIHKEHGAREGRSAEGLPVWRVDVAGRDAFLAVAEFEELALLRLKLDRDGVALSTR